MTTKFEDCVSVLGDEELCRKLQRYEQEEQRRKIRTFSEAEEQLICKSLANRSDWVKVVKAVVNEVLPPIVQDLQARNAALRQELETLQTMANHLGVTVEKSDGSSNWREILKNMPMPSSPW